MKSEKQEFNIKKILLTCNHARASSNLKNNTKQMNVLTIQNWYMYKEIYHLTLNKLKSKYLCTCIAIWRNYLCVYFWDINIVYRNFLLPKINTNICTVCYYCIGINITYLHTTGKPFINSLINFRNHFNWDECGWT